MDEIGVVFGEATNEKFEFLVNPKFYYKIRVGDIVKVKIGKVEAYGIIVGLNARQTSLPSNLDYETVEYLVRRLRIGEKVLKATVEFLGVLKDGNIYNVDMPPLPGEKVYYPSENEIRQLYQFKGPNIKIGCLSGKYSNIYPELSLEQIIIKHLAIFGMTGAGKSHTVAVLAKELLKNKIPFIIFDVHRDYVPTFENPLIITFDRDEVKIIKDQFERSGQSGDIAVKVLKIRPKEVNIDILAETIGINPNMVKLYYLFRKIIEDTDVQNVDQILGYLSDMKFLWKFRKSFDDERDLENTAARLRNRIERWKDWKIFPQSSKDLGDLSLKNLLSFSDSEEEAYLTEEGIVQTESLTLTSRPVIVDLMPLTLEEQRIVIDIFLTKIFQKWKEIYKKRRVDTVPLVIIVEEAHRFASKDTKVAKMLGTVAREGRKFGLGLWIVSQIPSKISEGIVSQINTYIFMRITNPRDLDFIQRSNPYLTSGYLQSLTSLNRGEALIVGLGVRRPVIVKIKSEGIKIGGSEYFIKKRIEELCARREI